MQWLFFCGVVVVVTRYIAASLMYVFVSQLNLGFGPNFVLALSWNTL